MNNSELSAMIHTSMARQCEQRGYAAPVDVLIDIGVLSKEKYSDWRFGRVPFLEAVCTVNLAKLSFIMRTMREYAREHGLKPSFTCYKQWGLKTKGKRPVLLLRFSKSGKPDIEKQYSTHYVDKARIEALKKEPSEE